jgi:hypothetical protein
MDFYWLYDVPLWLSSFLIMGVFVVIGVGGDLLFGKKCIKFFGLTVDDNEAIIGYLGLSGLFFGLTLGMIAVSTYENYNDVDGIVNAESSSLAALYRDVTILEDSGSKETLKLYLKKYTRYVVEEAWPQQRLGNIPKGGTLLMDTFQYHLGIYQPKSAKDLVVFGEVFDQYNVLIEKRRQRLNSVSTCLPSIIWLILILGSIVNYLLTWLIVLDNRRFEVLLNVLISIIMGSLVFWIFAMDNPYKGEYSVTPDSFELILNTIMK